MRRVWVFWRWRALGWDRSKGMGGWSWVVGRASEQGRLLSFASHFSSSTFSTSAATALTRRAERGDCPLTAQEKRWAAGLVTMGWAEGRCNYTNGMMKVLNYLSCRFYVCVCDDDATALETRHGVYLGTERDFGCGLRHQQATVFSELRCLSICSWILSAEYDFALGCE